MYIDSDQRDQHLQVLLWGWDHTSAEQTHYVGGEEGESNHHKSWLSHWLQQLNTIGIFKSQTHIEDCSKFE